jgi:hypothetical protein
MKYASLRYHAEFLLDWEILKTKLYRESKYTFYAQ